MERAVALGEGDRDTIDIDDMPNTIAEMPFKAESATLTVTDSPTPTDLEDIERQTIQRVFEQVKGDKALAGKMLGISRATLYRKLKRYNIGGRGPESHPSQALQ